MRELTHLCVNMDKLLPIPRDQYYESFRIFRRPSPFVQWRDSDPRSHFHRFALFLTASNPKTRTLPKRGTDIKLKCRSMRRIIQPDDGKCVRNPKADRNNEIFIPETKKTKKKMLSKTKKTVSNRYVASFFYTAAMQ